MNIIGHLMKGVYPVHSPLFNEFNLELKMQYSGKLKYISDRKDDSFMPSYFFFFGPNGMINNP